MRGGWTLASPCFGASLLNAASARVVKPGNVIRHDPTEALLKKTLLLIAGVGALVAIAAGFAGVTTFIGIGAGVMVIALILVGWLNESPSPADRADHGR